MAEIKKTCAKCGKPFTATDGRQNHCDACARCGSCKQQRGAHKDWCERGKGDKKKPTAKATGGGQTEGQVTGGQATVAAGARRGER